MRLEERIVNRQSIYQGPIFEVVKDEVVLPNEQTSYRDIILHNGAVAIIPITPTNKLILVKQWRQTIEKITYEIPAGKIEKQETNLLKRAQLELEEETGYHSEQWQFLEKHYTAIGFSNEQIHLYLATQLTKIPNPKPQDEDEFVEMIEVDFPKIKQLIKEEKIVDSKTIIAINYYEKYLKGEI